MHYCELDGRIEITAATLVAISRMRAAREYLSDGELQAGGGADAVWRRQLTGQERREGENRQTRARKFHRVIPLVSF